MIGHLEAGEELRDSTAFALGYANAKASKKNARIKGYLRTLKRRAFPQIYDD